MPCRRRPCVACFLCAKHQALKIMTRLCVNGAGGSHFQYKGEYIFPAVNGGDPSAEPHAGKTQKGKPKGKHAAANAARRAGGEVNAPASSTARQQKKKQKKASVSGQVQQDAVQKKKGNQKKKQKKASVPGQVQQGGVQKRKGKKGRAKAQKKLAKAAQS